MTPDRRDFLKAALGAAAAASYQTSYAAPTSNLGIPGPYPGKVVAMQHEGSIVNGKYNREAVKSMLHQGLMNLTGTKTPQDAWRTFFEPGDVVGVKLNPVGRPHVISAPEVFHEILEGLKYAGVKMTNVVAYDRYKQEFLEAGFDKWLPEGVRYAWGTDKTHPLQLDMDYYDANEWIEMPLVLPQADARNPHHRRSYLAKFITKDVNKMINLCLLKHHQSAGVTIALKNLSHGLVNNVSRSHSSSTLNTCGTFIPNVVDHPIIRKKVVLNICDGILGGYHGGPGGKIGKYKFEHKTMYLATDPVALDKTGWKVVDAERVKAGMKPVAEAPPDNDSRFRHMQVEHIEIAGALGLGEWDDKKIQVSNFKLA
jgi:uncharacterized protein (DUF362 family)